MEDGFSESNESETGTWAEAGTMVGSSLEAYSYQGFLSGSKSLALVSFQVTREIILSMGFAFFYGYFYQVEKHTAVVNKFRLRPISVFLKGPLKMLCFVLLSHPNLLESYVGNNFRDLLAFSMHYSFNSHATWRLHSEPNFMALLPHPKLVQF